MNIDAAAGAVEEVERIVGQVLQVWPGVRVLLRGDAGFCGEALMAWCEREPGVYFVFGLARNTRLEAALSGAMERAKAQFEQTQQPARVFEEFSYQTLQSWSQARRVVGKAEVLPQGPNPRFIVTNLPASEYPGQELYERVYCARGEMEKCIKEQELALFADRTSTNTMWGNELRVHFSAMAYTLMVGLRRLGLGGTE